MLLLPEGQRRYPLMFFEKTAKISRVRKAKLVGDLGHIDVRVQKQRL